MSTKSTLQKLISFTQKEIDNLLIQKSNIEFEISSLNAKIIALQESLDYELQAFSGEVFDHYYIARFVEFQLKKQKEISIAIDSNKVILDNLIEEIVRKELDKKKYEHLVNEYLVAEQREIDRREQNMIDEYALRMKNSG